MGVFLICIFDKVTHFQLENQRYFTDLKKKKPKEVKDVAGNEVGLSQRLSIALNLNVQLQHKHAHISVSVCVWE